VFPSSIGVNPQLTVMALADYASQFIAEARGK
jgi:choline dehydrogenase-like flavoprotein